MQSHAATQVFVLPDDGRCDVQNASSSEVGDQTLGEGALAAAGAAEDERVDAYSSSRRAEISRPFSASPRTATRKNPGPSPINGPQPRTSNPRRASRAASPSGPPTRRKFAAPGKGCNPWSSARALTGHDGCRLRMPSASSQTRQPSRKPGIAKNLVKDRATHSPSPTIPLTLIPGAKSTKASSTTSTAPASLTRSATSRTSP